MWDSESNGNSPKVMSESGGLCRTPPGHLGVGFKPFNDFETGMGVAATVDGVLCTNLKAAKELMAKRMDAIYAQWVTQVEKM